MMVGGAAQNWGPFVGAMFYVFVNNFARSVGEDPSNSIFLGWFVDEGTKINGLGGVTFGVLLILFARFVPLGAVGTMKLWRAKVVQVVPRLPVAATAGAGVGALGGADQGTAHDALSTDGDRSAGDVCTDVVAGYKDSGTQAAPPTTVDGGGSSPGSDDEPAS
jgi:hypothetical protein